MADSDDFDSLSSTPVPGIDEAPTDGQAPPDEVGALRAELNKAKAQVEEQRALYLRALADFEKAMALSPRDAQPFYGRANVRNARGDTEGAIADYDEAIARAPGYAVAFNGRGLARRAGVRPSCRS